MMTDIFKEKVNSLIGDLKVDFNVPMSRYTSFKAGGYASILVEPRSPEDIIKVIDASKELELPYMVIGNGSNLLFSDKGYNGIIIRIAENMNHCSFGEDGVVSAGAGLLLSSVSKESINRGFMGLEWAGGIPGTIGGAVVMNAGAYGGEIKDVLKEVIILENNVIKHVVPKDEDMSYRKCSFVTDLSIVLGATLQLRNDDGSAVDRFNECNRLRKEKQPLSYPSAGSTFKRPQGYFAGKLIEDAGLKGTRIGGAMVSEKHAGFIINTGDATASDIYELINYVKEKVFKTSGVVLETEVRLIGKF